MENLTEILGQIKDLKRSGWVKREVSDGESVADHSFGVSLLAYLLCPPHLNKEKCLEMAIVHDIAEIVTGDFTPCDNISQEEKSKNEIIALMAISKKINKPDMVDLFIEYEKKETPEAIYMKELDKIEAIMQAKYYDNHNRTKFYKKNKSTWSSLKEEFASNAESKIDLLSNIFEKIK